ncbi:MULTISPECIES: DUF5753 domain-containing protein [Actinomadura]|uniref:DUF5753 domain-containing protein n=1 Tax=Actinomadura yumaensis TaxID=111807 RepID=A0ABW2CBR5_9ACTN|nr:DUF5753 domain-containing protein [Actinomadura sp. J1-007]MWK33381.1 helix-turn-helix domain-containing protein [Actinomadura sp. J1-007]
MTSEIDPTTSATALYAYRIRKERERIGASQAEAAAAAHISRQLYGHYETMRRIPSLDASGRLDAFYGLPDTLTDLQPLVAKEVGTLASFLEFADQEEKADSIRTYQPLIIPGFFQTEAYVRAILSMGTRADQIERLVATRLARQANFFTDDPPFVLALIAERALRENVGGFELMREQLRHLLELAEHPTIHLQVIPAGAPVYASGEFYLLGYSEGGDLGYVEGANGHGSIIEASGEVHDLGLLFDHLQSSAETIEKSRRLIEAILESP